MIFKNIPLKKGKKAAMEMSVGTIVTIVLLMTVLGLGLFLVRNIFTSAETSIEGIDQAVKNEINKLFSEDDTRKVIVYPPTKLITIKKGNEKYRGFAFSIRNIENNDGAFKYIVSVNDPNIRQNCGISASEAESWIKLGGEGTINIGAGNKMEDEEFVRFLIPDNSPICGIRYGLDIKKDGQQYGNTVNIDLEIKPS